MGRPFKPDKPKPKSIGFKNGAMKDEIEKVLDNPRMQELMTDEEKQFLSGRVYWAVNYLDKMLNRGKLEVPLPMFEPVRSAEVVGLETQVENLRDELFWERQAIGEIEVLLMEEATKGDEYARELRAKIDALVRKSREKHVTIVRQG